jgi:hypothetical protein
MFYAKGDKKGLYDLDEYWYKEEGFLKTQAVVLDFLTQQDIETDERFYPPLKHIVWLNNLFTSIRLL